MKLEIRVDEDLSSYDKHDGWSVCLFADGKCVFAKPVSSREEGEIVAAEKRKLLGLAKKFRIEYTTPSGPESLVYDGVATLMEASAYANRNAPTNCTSISVSELP